MSSPHRIYRALIHLYPADFRRDYGPDLVQHLDDLVHREAVRGHGILLQAWPLRDRGRAENRRVKRGVVEAVVAISVVVERERHQRDGVGLARMEAEGRHRCGCTKGKPKQGRRTEAEGCHQCSQNFCAK